jgi:TetR/AcrR family transcriptional regulator, transcriptional repressor for nem operon
MPWPKEHKQATRKRIVSAAAKAFRRQGIADVGVAEVMQSAGLTHGGFYSHFDSKDDLIAEALDYAGAEAFEFATKGQSASVENTLLAHASAYLSVPHLTHPERGCPIAALGPELSRGSQNVRRTLGSGIRERLERLGELDKHGTDREAKRRAAGVFACMVGGMVLARAMKESDAATFLSDCREFLSKALARDNGGKETLPA